MSGLRGALVCERVGPLDGVCELALSEVTQMVLWVSGTVQPRSIPLTLPRSAVRCVIGTGAVVDCW